MVRRMSMAALLVVLVATLLQSSYARTYTVGDSTGWRIPTNNTDFYDDWADNKDFVVGDVLVFNFTTAQHNVAEVTEAGYDACSSANTNLTVSNGPARITLNRTGDYYFICAFPGHCAGGQKLNVEVGNGTSSTNTTAPSPAPAPKSSPTTPPTSSPTAPPTSSRTTPGTSSPTTPPTSSRTTPGTSSPPSSASSLVATLSLVFFMPIAFFLLY